MVRWSVSCATWRPARLAAAVEILAPVASLLGLSLPGSSGLPPTALRPRLLADELARTSLFESILTCVPLAERSTIVLVVEDLQWADSASAELIDFLARNLSDAPS